MHKFTFYEIFPNIRYEFSFQERMGMRSFTFYILAKRVITIFNCISNLSIINNLKHFGKFIEKKN